MNPQAIVAGAKYQGLDLEGLIDGLKTAGPVANFGSSGIGSATHLAGELFNRETGTALVRVPYRGQGPALNDVLGRRLDVVFPLAADVFSFLKSGKLHALAMMSDARAKSLPDLPTTAELGLPKLKLSPIWTALYTVAGTPAPIVARLNRELVRIITAPRVRGTARGFRLRGARVDPGRARNVRGGRHTDMGRDHPSPRRALEVRRTRRRHTRCGGWVERK